MSSEVIAAELADMERKAERIKDELDALLLGLSTSLSDPVIQ